MKRRILTVVIWGLFVIVSFVVIGWAAILVFGCLGGC
jgi:hypothetical protein